MKTAREALATHLNMDMSELSEYAYQSGRFTKTVYNLEIGYYCATKDPKKLPQPISKQTDKFEWVEVKDAFLNSYGWLIFKV